MVSKTLSPDSLVIPRFTLIIISLIAIFLIIKLSIPIVGTKEPSSTHMSYRANIIKATQDNIDFRHVLFTGPNSQLVVMSIPAGEEVGTETHKYTEQTLFFLSGTGEGELNGSRFPVGPGDVVVVVPGTEHNFRNTGTQPLKIYTVYAPPNHIDGRIELTKADADADTADEAIGETKPLPVQ